MSAVAQTRAVRWRSEPAVHFLLLSLLIFGGHRLLQGRDSQSHTIVIERSEIAELEDRWTKSFQREPTERERQNFIKQYIQDEILVREAVAMGLHDGDELIRRRLIQKMRFVAFDRESVEEVTETQMRVWFDRHQNDFKKSRTVQFKQVFLRRGSSLERRRALASQLDGVIPPESTAALGDPFLGKTGTAMSHDQLVRNYGDEFSDAVMNMTPGAWHGPVPSRLGYHFIFVQHMEAESIPSFETVRSEVRNAIRLERERESNRALMRRLESRYRVSVETELMQPQEDLNELGS